MKLIDQIQATIQTLPEEAQQDLWEYVQNLSHKYSLSQPTQGKSLYEKFQEKGLIGCLEDDENVSTNYKQALTEEWSKKYGIQNKSQPRQKGSAKGKLIIHSEDNDHLEAFQDYMPS